MEFIRHIRLAARKRETRGFHGVALAVLLCASGPAWAQFSACDLNQDGVVNATDVTLATNMALGTTPCTANVEGALTCTVITVQRVVNASLGQPCSIYNGHKVTLNWVSSTSSVVGYNIYRGAASTGPYTKMNSALIAGASWADTTVAAGQTYYYVATSVDVNGNESGYSTPTPAAIIPSP
jgi:hypothetical protein